MNKILLLLGTLCLLATQSVYSQYRVKSFQRTSFHKGESLSVNFTYAEDKLVKYTETHYGSTTIYDLKYDKNKITVQSGKWKEDIKFDKEGRLKQAPDLKMDYNKDGSLKWYGNKNRSEILNDEKGRMRVDNRQTLLFYNKEDKVEAIKNLVDRKINNCKITWDGDRVVRIEGMYDNGGDEPVLHEFVYDDNGLLVEEKIYCLEGEEEQQTLTHHYVVTYEEGEGNANEVYKPFSNVVVQLMLKQQTYFSYTRQSY